MMDTKESTLNNSNKHKMWELSFRRNISLVAMYSALLPPSIKVIWILLRNCSKINLFIAIKWWKKASLWWSLFINRKMSTLGKHQGSVKIHLWEIILPMRVLIEILRQVHIAIWQLVRMIITPMQVPLAILMQVQVTFKSDRGTIQTQAYLKEKLQTDQNQIFIPLTFNPTLLTFSNFQEHSSPTATTTKILSPTYIKSTMDTLLIF